MGLNSFWGSEVATAARLDAEATKHVELVKSQIEKVASQEGSKGPSECECAADLGPLVAYLKEGLRSLEVLVRITAAEALKTIGKEAAPAIPELKVALKYDSNWELQTAAANALGAIGKEAAVAIPELEVALRDSIPEVGFAAANALGAIGREEPQLVLPRLRKALKDSNASVRESAARALRAMGWLTIPDLAKALKDSNKWNRVEAARALGDVGKKAATVIPELQDALKDSSDDVCRAAANALIAIGREVPHLVLPGLRRALKDSDRRFQGWVVRAFEGMGQEAAPAIPDLAKLLKDPGWWVSAAAAKALAAMGPAGIAQLQEALKDSEEHVRRMAASALRDIGHEV